MSTAQLRLRYRNRNTRNPTFSLSLSLSLPAWNRLRIPAQQLFPTILYGRKTVTALLREKRMDIMLFHTKDETAIAQIRGDNRTGMVALFLSEKALTKVDQEKFTASGFLIPISEIVVIDIFPDLSRLKLCDTQLSMFQEETLWTNCD